MKIEQQYYNILWHKQPKDILLAIEQAGRTCYKSEDKITETSATPFVERLIASGHESVLEHHDFCIGNAIKYLWRAGLKSGDGISKKEKQIEDLKKAIWYIKREIKHLSNGEE